MSEYSAHDRDARFADGRAAVVLAVLSFLSVVASAAFVVLVTWR